MAVIDRPIIMPKLAFLTAWSMVGVGEVPPAFGTNLHVWTTADGRRELEAKAMTALAELGLARNNRLNGLWRSTATLLAGAGLEYYAFSNFADGRACSVLIAVRDGDAIRAIVDDHVVSLEPIENRWFATALLDTLPDEPAAAIRSVVLPRAPRKDVSTPAGHSPANERDTRDLEHLEETMRRPRRAVHQIYVARRGTDGERLRSLPITAVDLDESGRFLVYTDSDDDIVLVAGTARQFVSTLNKTYAAL